MNAYLSSSTLHNYEIKPLSLQRTLNVFNLYVRSSQKQLKHKRLENGDYFWAHIRGSTNPIWDKITDIAIHLHSSPCNCFLFVKLHKILLKKQFKLGILVKLLEKIKYMRTLNAFI